MNLSTNQTLSKKDLLEKNRLERLQRQRKEAEEKSAKKIQRSFRNYVVQRDLTRKILDDLRNGRESDCIVKSKTDKLMFSRPRLIFNRLSQTEKPIYMLKIK